jgi:histone deacetylase complex regulatory component SIN3
VISIPDELKSLQKSEVNFFLERIPSLMKNGDATEFYKLLELYLEGVITKYEFFDIVDPLILPSEKENLRQI